MIGTAKKLRALNKNQVKKMTMVVNMIGQMNVMERCGKRLSIETWNDNIKKVNSMDF